MQRNIFQTIVSVLIINRIHDKKFLLFYYLNGASRQSRERDETSRKKWSAKLLPPQCETSLLIADQDEHNGVQIAFTLSRHGDI